MGIYCSWNSQREFNHRDPHIVPWHKPSYHITWNNFHYSFTHSSNILDIIYIHIHTLSYKKRTLKCCNYFWEPLHSATGVRRNMHVCGRIQNIIWSDHLQVTLIWQPIVMEIVCNVHYLLLKEKADNWINFCNTRDFLTSKLNLSSKSHLPSTNRCSLHSNWSN